MSSGPQHDRVNFRTTSWSLVAAAVRQHSDDPDPLETNRADAAEEGAIGDALEQLCSAYWYPVYAFVRRSGHDRDQAEDLTQGFFAKLLEKDYLADADRSRGRFRTFLLACVKHFIANERERAEAIKRGGGVRHFSLDFNEAETRYAGEPMTGWSAEAIYDRNWAMSLLREVLAATETQYRNSGKGDLFSALVPQLTRQPDANSLASVAQSLGMSIGAVKVAAYRLRTAYRKNLTEVVAATLEGSGDVDAERRLLLNAISGGRGK